MRHRRPSCCAGSLPGLITQSALLLFWQTPARRWKRLPTNTPWPLSTAHRRQLPVCKGNMDRLISHIQITGSWWWKKHFISGCWQFCHRNICPFKYIFSVMRNHRYNPKKIIKKEANQFSCMHSSMFCHLCEMLVIRYQLSFGSGCFSFHSKYILLYFCT